MPWYSSVPVGKNTLATKVKKMCEQAKISGNKTNHSLRATGATSLFAEGVPEKVIQERTGHRSLEALRVYEHTSARQHQVVSNLLSARPSASDIIPNQSTNKSITMQQHPCLSLSSHISSTSQEQSIFPGIQFHGNLNGCTININPHGMQSSTNKAEKEIDNFFASLQDII